MSRRTGKNDLNSHTKIKRDPNQEFTSIDGEIIMLNKRNAEYIALNDTASRIWTLIEKPILVSNLIELLVKEFDIDHAQCQADTMACLDDFRNKEMIITVNDH